MLSKIGEDIQYHFEKQNLVTVILDDGVQVRGRIFGLGEDVILFLEFPLEKRWFLERTSIKRIVK